MAPAIIIAILGLATAGTGVAQQVIAGDQSKGACQNDCKATCKAKHKALFDGRQKCITECEAECVIKGNQPPAPAPAPESFLDTINWWYVGGAVLTIVAIIVYVSRKK